MSGAPHLSVLLDEVTGVLRPGPGQIIIDGTFGAGGYARAFLDSGAQVVALDRDPSARRFARPLEATGRFKLIEARFSEMGDHFDDASVDGVALDIGVSSMQLDEAERGFSFMRDGPLDMRMSDKGPTAADLVNTLEKDELARIIWLYGEERESRRIASFLVRRRAERLFERTIDLAEVVERALGGRRGAKTHPATKTFQALRIAVNEELTELETGLAAAERILKTGGRLAVVTFHSLEDRIVKAFFTARSGNLPGGSRHAPPVAGGPAPTFELPFKGAKEPGEAELAANPRARSAKLRAGVRTDAPAWRDAA
ncbi:MAG: 16S rRNA (cytosine(1402)-N(4))-methyltransferase RsmH [Caulobacter sp.]|nr:16S rRNA (cytosine(1402)-N(4))-methyltransferase RsmH [Caulobacter sp.]